MARCLRVIAKSSVFLLVSSFFLTAQAQTLPDATQYAIDHNPDVIYQVKTRYDSEQGLAQAGSERFPVVNLRAGYGTEQSENPTANVFAPSNPALPRRDLGASARQHIFTGYAVLNEIKRNQAVVRSNAFKVASVANDLALNVTQQYLQVLMEYKLVDVAKKNLAENESIAGMIGSRSEAGVDRKSDYTQVRGRVDLARSNLIAEQSRLDDAKAHYEKDVGADPIDLTMPTTPDMPALPKSQAEIIAVGLTNHPIIRSANADILAAIAQHKASRSTNYPKVDFVANFDRNNNVGGIPGPNYDNLAMIQAYYDLNLGGKDFARQKQTAYQIQEAIQVRDRAIRQLEESTALSWNALVNSGERIKYLEGHLAAARATLGAYQEQFKVGKRTLLDLLDQQNEYYQSQIDYTTEIYTELFARYRLLSDMGKINDYLHVTLPAAAEPPEYKSPWQSTPKG
jgi:adhesin transport system outer membrane protein